MRGTRVIAAVMLTVAGTSPAQAASTTVIGDLAGTLRSVHTNTLSVGVTAASPALRLLKSHWLSIATTASTLVRRDGKTVRLRALRAQDVVTVRVRCTYTITNSSTRIRCTAVRVNASSTQRPLPVRFAINGSVVAMRSNGFSVTADSIDHDERATPVVNALGSPIEISTDSATTVRFGQAASTLASLTISAKVLATVECQPLSPFDCRAVRIEITLPPAEPVVLIGIVTIATANSVSIDVESATHAAALNVRMLRYNGLLITVAAGVAVTRGADAIALSSLVPGLRITVNAHCRLTVPFNCTADRVRA